MFPGRSAEELFSLGKSEVLASRGDVEPPKSADRIAEICPAPQLADVAAVFGSRSAFTSVYPPSVLFDSAREINAAGLSLNVLCQNYPDHRLKRLLESGTTIRCLFLNPEGSAIRAREDEEGYRDGTLTTLNISMLTRLRGRLTPEAAKLLESRVHDETIRFNILIADETTCVVQPYLPQARGAGSPTIVINDNTAADGLFPVFDQVFTSMWERSSPV